MLVWIILILGIVLFVCWLSKPLETPVYTLDDIYDKLKTGDIILFSSKNNGNLIQSSIYVARTRLVGSEYGHVGIILRDETGVYLVECCNPTQVGHESSHHLNNTLQGGVRIIRLETILFKYHAMYGGFFAVKPIKQEIPVSIMMEALYKYQDSIFEDIGFVYFVALLDNLVSKDAAKKIISKYRPELFEHHRMTCGEFVYKLLMDCGVAKPCRSKLIWPHVYTGNRFTKLTSSAFDDHVSFNVDPITSTYITATIEETIAN